MRLEILLHIGRLPRLILKNTCLLPVGNSLILIARGTVLPKGGCGEIFSKGFPDLFTDFVAL